MPASLTHRAHFAKSSRTKASNSSGVLGHLSGQIPPPSPVGVVVFQGRGGRGGRGGSEGPMNEPSVEERLGDRLIEGVLASGVRRTTTIGTGAIGNEQPIKIVSEEWTSPDLQILVMTDRTDPRVGHSTYRLLKIVRSDPDPALFQVPADYTLQHGPGLGGRGAGAVIERPR